MKTVTIKGADRFSYDYNRQNLKKDIFIEGDEAMTVEVHAVDSGSGIEEIFSLCKAEVSVEYNPHRSYYESVEVYLKGLEAWDEIPEDIKVEMVKRDTVISIQAYEHTPVGFFKIYHYDFGSAVKKMLEILHTSKAETL